MAKKTNNTWYQPSLLIVVVAGTITLFFLVSIVREIIQANTVRQQVKRLRQEVIAETSRQEKLKDLLSYLDSPTFQERQARLQLGVKKEGERVIIVPNNDLQNNNANGSIDQENSTVLPTNPSRWWSYFFDPNNKVN